MYTETLYPQFHPDNEPADLHLAAAVSTCTARVSGAMRSGSLKSGVGCVGKMDVHVSEFSGSTKYNNVDLKSGSRACCLSTIWRKEVSRYVRL